MRDLGLIASEGRFSIPVEDGTPAGELSRDGDTAQLPEDGGTSSSLIFSVRSRLTAAWSVREARSPSV